MSPEEFEEHERTYRAFFDDLIAVGLAPGVEAPFEEGARERVGCMSERASTKTIAGEEPRQLHQGSTRCRHQDGCGVAQDGLHARPPTLRPDRAHRANHRVDGGPVWPRVMEHVEINGPIEIRHVEKADLIAPPPWHVTEDVVRENAVRIEQQQPSPRAMSWAVR
jgi:hypothetical protein